MMADTEARNPLDSELAERAIAKQFGAEDPDESRKLRPGYRFHFPEVGSGNVFTVMGESDSSPTRRGPTWYIADQRTLYRLEVLNPNKPVEHWAMSAAFIYGGVEYTGEGT